MSYHSSYLCDYCYQSLPHIETKTPENVLFNYQFPIDVMLKRLKFNDDIRVSLIFGELLAQQLYHHSKAQVLVPVPLAQRRYYQRGFNQVRAILQHCNHIAPCLDGVLVRQRHTKAQTELNAKQREHNLKNAFTVCQPITKNCIALVDDVITTGATTRACTKALQINYQGCIEIWAIAKVT